MTNFSYWNLKAGDVHDFNGAPVRLVKVVAAASGQTWRVEYVAAPGTHASHLGKRFNIDPRCLSLLSREAVV